MADILNAREKINSIDKEMAKLFELRMDAAYEVAQYKKETGLQIEDIKREEAIIAKSKDNVKNPEYLPYYIDFIKNNMKVSKAYQRKLLKGIQVAISGTKGAFADITAKKVFPYAENLSFTDFSAAYCSVENGESNFALLPLENSFGGDVGTVLDLAFFGSLYINGIYESDIVQNLIGLNESDITDIKTVISHPQALLQCNDFISKNGFETLEAPNTTTAIESIKNKQDITVAAIGSEEAAKYFGLKIIKNHINESNQNTTRFAVFSKTIKNDSPSDNRFILMFTVKNSAGALSKAISVIGDYGYNLLDLKSRPTKLENWNHYFYIEGEGNITSDNGKQMVKELKKFCDNFKIVGSFEKEVRV